MNYKNIKVYRGMYILKEHFEEQFQPSFKNEEKKPQKWKTSQKGFQCTTMDKNVAINFACP